MPAETELGAGAKPRWSPWRLWPVGVLGAGCAAAFAFGLDDYLSLAAIRDNRHHLLAWRDHHYGAAALGYVAAYAGLVALSVPGAVWMTILGGFVFGAVPATAYAVVAATAGASVVFLAARYAFADALRTRAGPGIKRMEAGFRENALSYMLVLRLVPLFPFWLVNLVPAFLGVPFKTFALGTLVGIVPGTFVYSTVGGGLGAVLDSGAAPDLGIIFSPAILLPIGGLVVLSLAPVVYKRVRKRRAATGGTSAHGDHP